MVCNTRISEKVFVTFYFNSKLAWTALLFPVQLSLVRGSPAQCICKFECFFVISNKRNLLPSSKFLKSQPAEGIRSCEVRWPSSQDLLLSFNIIFVHADCTGSRSLPLSSCRHQTWDKEMERKNILLIYIINIFRPSLTKHDGDEEKEVQETFHSWWCERSIYITYIA